MLCKEFGWTITELDDQPADTVQKFVQIMNIRNSIEGQQNG